MTHLGAAAGSRRNVDFVVILAMRVMAFLHAITVVILVKLERVTNVLGHPACTNSSLN